MGMEQADAAEIVFEGRAARRESRRPPLNPAKRQLRNAPVTRATRPLLARNADAIICTPARNGSLSGP